MEKLAYRRLAEYAETPAAVERSVAYVMEQFSRFLKKNERVLICFPYRKSAACYVTEQAVRRLDCTPIWLGEDFRWITIVKTAFTHRCSCIMAPPLTLLGLSKVAKYMGIPLFARNVVMAGYPTTHWLVDGVRRGLDCMAWGCFDPGIGAVISGFTCPEIDGVHIRSEEYAVDIVDEDGNCLPEGELGRVIIYPLEDPTIRFPVGDLARISPRPCPCGCKAPKLIDIDTVKPGDPELSSLGESLHLWSSILDCRIEKTEYGLELELVVFPGEKLPKLPTTAKLLLRNFDPDTDVPFAHQEVLQKRFLSAVAH